MHPAASIILFTTLSGAGFGMIAFLGLDVPAPRGWTAFADFALAYGLAGGGLLASVFHLGHPERALKALTQWRSSWLSREAWLAVLTLALAGLYAIGLVFFRTRIAPFGVPAGALALGTVFATSMIYMQMQSVPRWNHWSPPVVFLGYAVTAGALLTAETELALLFLPALMILQILAWTDQERRERTSDTTIATATGLGTRGTVRAFEPPHTGTNYLMNEMGFRIARKHALRLKAIALALAMVLPFLLIATSGNPFVVALAAASHILGTLVQRWLFFAEARHVVSLYYGR